MNDRSRRCIRDANSLRRREVSAIGCEGRLCCRSNRCNAESAVDKCEAVVDGCERAGGGRDDVASHRGAQGCGPEVSCCAVIQAGLRNGANRKSGDARSFKAACATVAAESQAAGGSKRGELETQDGSLAIWSETAPFLVQRKPKSEINLIFVILRGAF